MSAFLDKAIAIGLVAILIFSALAFGSNEPWSVGLFELVITVLVLLWAIKFVADKRLKISVPAAAAPIAGLVALGLVQSVSRTGGDGRIHTLSMDVEATRGAAAVLFFLLASFIIAANFFVTRERLATLANVLVIFGLAMSVFALMQHFTWDGHIYWVRHTTGTAFGPFANRNHYAGYMEMLVPVPLALVLARGARKESWMFYGFASAVMALTVIVSLSRGGIVSLMAGIALVVMMSAKHERRRARTARGESRSDRAALAHRSPATLGRLGAVAIVVVVIALGVIWIGAEGLINRAADSVDQMRGGDPQGELFSRTEIWKDSWKMILDHPVTGIGLGAYETVFPAYARHNGMLLVDYAHNDYIQALTDGGIVGGLLAAAFIVLILRAMFRGMRSGDSLLAALAIGCGAGVCSMLVHSVFDFNLQIPSNALLFLFLSAVVSHIATTVDERNPEGAPHRAAGVNVGGYATGV
ncbi:MAG TPA: O-antigen ligase family protein [Blastocatellia bacterium]|jgi:O-antigen ligase|nr:O-antigen ligase family protein [Blastocatellia bacterium]